MTTKIVNHKKDDAVSPVVGVMLMLVVTIVIAAVVALFATSVVTDTEAAPVAVIQMDAYNGDPDLNSNLCMSIIGGKALELSKLKCVVTIEDGKYGIVFKSLDTDPLVGKFLEIGEKLEVFNFDDDNEGMRKINALIGGDLDSDYDKIVGMIKDAWEVGNKVNVMIVFDEDAILYKKDIIIQDGLHQVAITFDTTTVKDGKWYYQYIEEEELDPTELTNLTITADKGSRIYYSIDAAGTADEMVIIAIPGPNDTRSTVDIVYLAYPIADNTFTGAKYGDSVLIEEDFDTNVIDDSDTLAMSVGAVTKYSVTYDKNGAKSGEAPTDSKSYLYEEKATVLGQNGMEGPDGKTEFKGWNPESTATLATYTEGEELEISGNVTLYAIWAAS